MNAWLHLEAGFLSFGGRSSRLVGLISRFNFELKMQTLDELESHLKTLLEINLLKTLPGFKAEDRIYQHLAMAMYKSLRILDGTIFAPNIYMIIAHPTTINRWNSNNKLFTGLTEALRTAGEEGGFHFLTPPTVSTTADTNMSIKEIQINALYASENLAETRGMEIESQPNAEVDSIPMNAFLMQAGRKIIPLDLPVINIGRRLDNQIVIDDHRVSRTHAQIRGSKGRFTLFDLNSKGGTYVNNQRINSSFLNPGDMISLAGVKFIFSQDLPNRYGDEFSSTRPRRSVSPDDLLDHIPQTAKKIGKEETQIERSSCPCSATSSVCQLVRLSGLGIIQYMGGYSATGCTPLVPENPTHQPNNFRCQI
jgi:hypothetical protein